MKNIWIETIICFLIGFLIGRTFIAERQQVVNPEECLSVCVEEFEKWGC